MQSSVSEYIICRANDWDECESTNFFDFPRRRDDIVLCPDSVHKSKKGIEIVGST